MANFDAQIEALVGSSTQTEMDDWMTEGAKEVINILPYQLKIKASSITDLYISNTDTTLDMDGKGEILHVTRENADSGYYTPCREIPPSFGDLSNDSTNMMYYATATDPVYWIDTNSSGNPTLFVKPTPTAAQPANITHITYPSINASEASSIANFPDEAEYLVVLYASIKSLQNKMNNITAISDLSISSSAPSAPSLGTVSYSNASNADASSTAVSAVTVATVSKADISGNAPTYTKPTLAGTSTNMLTEIESGTLGSSEEDYEKWFHIAGQYIEDEEDTELAQAQLQKIQTYLQAFSQDIQNELNEFNKENEIYKANIQAELAKHNSDLQKAITQAQIDAQDKQQEAAQTTDVDKFNKSQDQALALQNAAKTMEATIQNNNNLIAKYQQEISVYSQNVNKEVTQYRTNLEQYGLEFQQYQAQQAKLQQDYDRGIQMLVAQYMPAQPVKGE